jgi:hypothetical protein
MDSRKRFLTTSHGGQPDHLPLFPESIREKVLLSWRTQGLPDGVDLDHLFLYEQFEQLDPDIYPNPAILSPSSIIIEIHYGMSLYPPKIRRIAYEHR